MSCSTRVHQTHEGTAQISQTPRGRIDLDPRDYLKPKNEGEKALDSLPNLLCVSVCGVCVCVCVCVSMRERESGEGERERERVCNKCDHASMYCCIFMQSLRETFV